MNDTERLYEHYSYTLDCFADEPECDDPESRRRLLKACANGMREAAKGLVRYEIVRKMNPREFAELFQRNIDGYGLFDTLVDERK